MGEVIARVKYSKEYPANLVGHLDTMAAIQRSMRRATWPLKFTAGFNPRIKLSFTPSLRLGFTSDTEYVDVALIRPLEQYQIEKFRRSTVEGIKIKNVWILHPEEPGINEKLTGFRYMVRFMQPGKDTCRTGVSPVNASRLPDEGIENIVERGDDYIVLDVLKKNGGFKNPLKILGEGKYEIKKIKCHWKE